MSLAHNGTTGIFSGPFPPLTTRTAPMKAVSLFLTRFSVGWLMVIWGVDKLVDVDHAVRLSDAFYAGIISAPLVWQVLGVAQTALGILVVVGLFRKYTYPILLTITGITLISVWASVIDPWGWFLEGTRVLFFPSTTVFFASLVIMAFQEEDTIVVGHRAS